MQRVLFIIPNLRGGGAERSALNVIRHLDRNKFKPSIFLIKNEGVFWNEISADVKVSTGLEPGERIRWHLLRLICKLFSSAKQADIVVGALEFESIYLAVLIGWIIKRPVAGWIHVNLTMYPRKNFIDSILTRWLYPSVAAMIAVSQGVATSFEQIYPKLRDKAITIYNPQEVDYIRIQAELVIDSISIPNVPIILGVGRLEYQKNFALLIRAHTGLLARGIRHRLIILGEGPERASLEKLICELGVVDTVSLPGFQANPFAIMKQAQVFVLSSRFEGLSGVMLQAMALGVPVVASDCPSGSDEILENGYYGLLVPPNDVDAMIEAIAKILSDSSLAANLSRVGMERADHFRPEIIIPQFERVLLEIGRGDIRS